MFKIGDKVKIKVDKDHYLGNEYFPEEAIFRGDSSTIGCVALERLDRFAGAAQNGWWNFRKEDLDKLISSSETINLKDKIMNLKEKFITAITPEPEKSFRKSGITDGDNLLTEDGEKVFLSWLLKKNAVDFKKEVVDDLLKEIKEEK